MRLPQPLQELIDQFEALPGIEYVATIVQSLDKKSSLSMV